MVTRTLAAEEADQMKQRSQTVRVISLDADRQQGAVWLAFGTLVGLYLDDLRQHHPWPPRAEDILAATVEPELATYVVYRGETAVGFAMAEGRESGTGTPVMWICHFCCPSDLGAARALLREIERLARARRYHWIAAETAMPDMRRRVAAGGLKPMATVYGKEVQHE
jgi:hypothetical protein